jgi:inner membrane protein
LLRSSQTDPIVRVAAGPSPINPFKWQGLIETADYYRSAPVDTRTDTVDTDASQTFYKPPVTMATLAAKRSYLGHIYLDWSSWPLVTDVGSEPTPGVESIPGLPTPPPDWHTVEFRDLRFFAGIGIPGVSKAAPPLSGSVYIGPGNEVEAMILSGREQR